MSTHWPTLLLRTALVGAIAFLALVPASVLASGPPLCLWTNVFGMECAGCGMTRALSAVLQARPAEAFAHNRLVIVVAPILAVVVWRVFFPGRRLVARGQLATKSSRHRSSPTTHDSSGSLPSPGTANSSVSNPT